MDSYEAVDVVDACFVCYWLDKWEKVRFCEMLGKTAEDMGLDGYDVVAAIVSNLSWSGDLLDSEPE